MSASAGDDDDGPMMSVAGANIPKFEELTPEQQQRITAAQAEIEALWSDSRKGNYQVDDDAWRSMPIFMENVDEEAAASNPAVAALQELVYGLPPDEVAANRKDQGNKMLTLALRPGQENPENLARAAIAHYNEGINAGSTEPKVNSQLYSNRSLAHFILKNYGHGLMDAQRAVILDRNYFKAYYRGAKCAERIRKYEIASQLVGHGLACSNPAPDATAQMEFKQLQDLIDRGVAQQKKNALKERATSRASAANSMHIVKTLQTKGVKVGLRPEVVSSQWAQTGSAKPYFDEDGIFVTPMLILYDEVQQSDYLKEVGGDSSMRDVLETLLPLPWDTEGRYRSVDDLAAVYKIDDGVAMPRYYKFDVDWQMMEVFRSGTYEMPSLLPCFHIVPKASPLLQQWSFAN